MRYLPVYFPKTLKTLSPYDINRKKPFQKPKESPILGFCLFVLSLDYEKNCNHCNADAYIMQL